MNRPDHLAEVDFSAVQGVDPDELNRRAGVGATDDPELEALRLRVIDALRTVHDPELPVNIYDLGLVYRLDISDDGDIAVDMTLTAPGCPVAGMMPIMVRTAVTDIDGVGLVDVKLVWEPPWSPESMSEAARLEMNLL
ncbi:MAG: DUF59 domain-containing protein [Thiohalocapsa sp.]